MSIRDEIPETATILNGTQFDCCIVGIQDGCVLYNANKIADVLWEIMRYDEDEATDWVNQTFRRYRMSDQVKNPPRYFWEI